MTAGDAGRLRAGGGIPAVVAMWNELTPYRLHVLRRIRDEVPEVRMVNVFTHSLQDNSMPWRLDLDPDLNFVFDGRCRMPRRRFFHRNAFATARLVRRIVAENDPIFVVMHSHNDLSRMLVIRSLSRMGVPMVHASDGNALDEQLGVGPRDLIRTAYLRAVLRRMDAYLVMGVGGKAFYQLHGKAGRPQFAFPYEPDYEGIWGCREEEVRAFRSTHALRQDRRHFLYSGRLVPIKRVDLIVRSFASIAGDFPDWDLVIAGQGPLREELERSVPPLLRDRVRFLGFLQMDQLRAAYLACDALVHASMREPWGLVISEAVAAGMAVIATDIAGSALELVKHRVNGCLVRPGSGDELSGAMRHVAEPGNLQRLRANSRRLLDDWRAAGDPILGFRDAVRYFKRRKKSSG